LNSGIKPDKIVIFRDGVSDRQFSMVLNSELKDLKDVFGEHDYEPKITVVLVVKHHTRFFPTSGVCNVDSGALVDGVITHPRLFDFFLCSQIGTLGTSKPIHYYVLWDENKFEPKVLQELTYALCFTSARCKKPVRLIPPVMYDDLAAYRGRLYYNASRNSIGTGPLKLHANVENTMYFV
jgi:eukaryotic translation initiation factor 2C